MGQYRIDFKTIPWDASAVGVRFKAYEQDTKKLRLAEFSKEFVEADWCTNGHIGYILEGQMEVDFDGKVIMFGPGDGDSCRDRSGSMRVDHVNEDSVAAAAGHHVQAVGGPGDFDSLFPAVMSVEAHHPGNRHHVGAPPAGDGEHDGVHVPPGAAEVGGSGNLQYVAVPLMDVEHSGVRHTGSPG